MLRNHEFRVRLAKPSKAEDESPTLMEKLNVDPEKIEKIVKDTATRTAITVGVLIIACKAVDILGEVIVKKTRSADNK